jgi:hypothetical protein
MKKTLSILILLSSAVVAAPFKVQNNNANNNGMMDSSHSFSATQANSSSNNEFPFNFETSQNWGASNNENRSSWVFNRAHISSISSKGYARTNSKYAAELETRDAGYAGNHAQGNTNTYYKDQLGEYGNHRGDGRFKGYGKKGHLGFAPAISHTIPASNN